MITRLAVAYYRFISRRRRSVVVVLVLGCLCMAYAARDVRLDSNFAHFFSRNSPDQAFLHAYQETFGADDTNLVAIISVNKTNQEALQANLGRLCKRLVEVDAYTNVTAITTILKFNT